jgi:hypothetical protein
MRKMIVLAAVAACFSMPAAAAGNSDSLGDCISDGLYGNEPNMADGATGGPSEQDPGSQAGNVLATQSPGPFVNNSNDPDNPTRGHSLGALIQEFDFTPAELADQCPF